VVAAWLLALAPIAIFPGAYDRWGWATLLFALTGAILALLARPCGRLPRWTLCAILAVVVILTVSALTGAAPLAQLLGRSPRYEGAITLVVLIGAGAAGARLFGPGGSRRERNALLRGLTVSTALLAFIAVLESFGLRPLDSDLERPGSLAGNATDQGILGVIAVAVLGAVLLHGRVHNPGLHPAWPIAGVVTGVVAVATSNSRAAIIALVIVGLGLGAMAVLGARSRRAAVLWSAAAGAVAFGIVVAVPLTRDRLFGTSAFAQQTIGDRVIIWGDAWRVFLAAPVLGVGPNGFMDAVTPLFGDGWFARARVGSILDSPHNIVLQAAVIGGILGLLAAGVLVLGGVIAGVRRIRTAEGDRRGIMVGALLAVAGAGAALLTHVTSPVTLVPLAVLFGPLVSTSPREAGERAIGRAMSIGRIAAVAALAIWTVFVTVCAVADVRLEEGWVRAVRGDVSGADASFHAAAALRPWDPDIAILAAQTLGAAQDNGIAGGADLAEPWARSAIAALPGSAQAQFIGGMVAMLRHDAPAAETRLSAAVRLMPADPRAHHELGILRLVTGNLAEARTELERATALDPSATSSWKALADVCRRLDDATCAATAESRTATG